MEALVKAPYCLNGNLTLGRFFLKIWAHFRREALETTPKYAYETLNVSILTI
jgi:hypothetical protein